MEIKYTSVAEWLGNSLQNCKLRLNEGSNPSWRAKSNEENVVVDTHVRGVGNRL